MAEPLANFLKNVREKVREIFGMETAMGVSDREGNILLRLEPAPNVCRFIMSSKKGKEACSSYHRDVAALAKENVEPISISCHAGFTGFYFPIIIDNQKLGAITCCLAMVTGFSEKEADKEISKKCQSLAEKYGLDKEKLEKIYRADFRFVSSEKKEKYLNLLKKTLQEVFEVYKQELKEFFVKKT